MSLLDTLEGIGLHNTGREELQQSHRSSEGGGVINNSVDEHGRDEDDDDGEDGGGAKAVNWLANASSMAEETLVSERKTVNRCFPLPEGVEVL